MTKYGKTEARVGIDGITRIWKFLPLSETGFPTKKGHWHRPQWVCIAAKYPNGRRVE